MTMQLVGWTILNAVWEGTAIAVVLAATRRWMRRASALARYTIGIAALGATVVVPIATTMVRTGVVADSTMLVPASVASLLQGPPRLSHSAVSATATVERSAIVASRALLGRADLLDWVAVMWLVGVVLLSIRMAIAVSGARRLSREGNELDENHLVFSIARHVAKRVGLQRVIRIVISTSIDVPMVVGWTAPVVLLPMSVLTGLTPMQLELLLAHELTHIRRFDTFVNFAQRIIETLLFFHPAVWWISSVVRSERENCCDDGAIALLGADRYAYAETLLTLEELRGATSGYAIAATDGGLLRRIRRIVAAEPTHTGVMSGWIPLGLSLVAVLLIAGPMNARITGTAARRASRVVVSTPVATTILDTTVRASVRHSAASKATAATVHADTLHREETVLRHSSVVASAALALATAPSPPPAQPDFSGKWTLVACGGCRDSMNIAFVRSQERLGPGWAADITIRQADGELTVINDAESMKTVYSLADRSRDPVVTADPDPSGRVRDRVKVVFSQSDLAIAQSAREWKGDTLVIALTGTRDTSITVGFTLSLVLDKNQELVAKWSVDRVRVRSDGFHIDFGPENAGAFKGTSIILHYRRM
jgi:beta-lactamase regulating signal transducer with metallopeptidase domain